MYWRPEADPPQIPVYKWNQYDFAYLKRKTRRYIQFLLKIQKRFGFDCKVKLFPSEIVRSWKRWFLSFLHFSLFILLRLSDVFHFFFNIFNFCCFFPSWSSFAKINYFCLKFHFQTEIDIGDLAAPAPEPTHNIHSISAVHTNGIIETSL